MATLPVILFVWLNILCDTFMTPCLRKLVRVCLAVIALEALCDYALYKSTFYLLTYLLSISIIIIEYLNIKQL